MYVKNRAVYPQKIISCVSIIGKSVFLKPAHKQINTYRPITDPQLDHNWHFGIFRVKRHLSGTNSILMACYHLNLDSASDWLQPVPGHQNEIMGKTIEWGRSEFKENVSSCFIFMLRFLNQRGSDYLGAWNRLDWLKKISLIIVTTNLKH